MPQAEREHAAAARARSRCNRDWVARTASEYVLGIKAARERTPRFTADVAQAHANFRLGRYLIAQGQRDEGLAILEAAAELNPSAWTLWRQMADLDTVGKAVGRSSGHASKRWASAILRAGRHAGYAGLIDHQPEANAQQIPEPIVIPAAPAPMASIRTPPRNGGP